MERKEFLIFDYPRVFPLYIVDTVESINGDAKISPSAVDAISSFAWDALITLIDRAVEYQNRERALVLESDYVIASYRDLPNEFVLSTTGDQKMFERANKISKRLERLKIINVDVIYDVIVSRRDEPPDYTRISEDADGIVDSYIITLISEVVGEVVGKADNPKYIKINDVRRIIRHAGEDQVWVVSVVNKGATDIFGVFDSPEKAYSGVLKRLLLKITNTRDYEDWSDEEFELEDDDENWSRFVTEKTNEITESMKSWTTEEKVREFIWKDKVYILKPVTKY